MLIGAIAGSFVAAILLRWPAGRSVLRGRSQCDSCGAALGARDLVPIVSWLALRGRCRLCGSRIDRRHVGIELTGAFVGFAAFHAHPPALAVVSALLGWWLLLIAVLDLEHQWLPDRLTLPLLPAGLAAAWLGLGPPLADRAIAAAAGYAALAGIAAGYRRLRAREGLGGGDPKLLAAIGAWLGWQQLPFVLLGAGLLGLTTILLVGLRGRRVAATDRLPLGTLMALIAWPIWLLVAAPLVP
ncbi:MAG TPA: prepilin peptidase [Allosphingosinicella sp.]|nr:prepilin peptidase [Allosphingosinicella sp.]